MQREVGCRPVQRANSWSGGAFLTAPERKTRRGPKNDPPAGLGIGTRGIASPSELDDAWGSGAKFRQDVGCAQEMGQEWSADLRATDLAR